jgi:hypothetical protein
MYPQNPMMPGASDPSASFAPEGFGQSLPNQFSGPAPAPAPGRAPLSPDLVSKALGTNKSAVQQQIARQRQLADMLRNSAREQLKGQEAGGIYKAPNIGNLAANIFGQYGAMKQDQGATDAGNAYDANMAGAAGDYFERNRKLGR